MAVYQSKLEARAERPATVVDINSWRINVPSQDVLIARILDDVRRGQSSTVFTINLDHFSRLRHDAEFAAAYRRARHVSADGVPVVLLARAEGVAIDRVTGADLVAPLAAAAADAQIPVYFFGTSEEILANAITNLRRKIPGLVVAGMESPPMGFDPKGEAARDAARRIAASGARICFVALGAPKQELFADVAVDTVDGVVFLGVGAALDFIAGHRLRAPRIFQMLGLEWAWRAAQEPRRLVPRYVRSGLWLIGYVLKGLMVGRPDLARYPDRD